MNSTRSLTLCRIKTTDFSVAQTFDCGQCFRFDPVVSTEHEVEYAGVAFGRYISFAQDGDILTITGTDEGEFESLWRRYLALDEDYTAIKRSVSAAANSPAMDEAIKFGGGIRILRQDPWEALCSFIISQNNNIPRIKKIIAAMSEKYGEPIGGGRFAFPTAHALAGAGEDELFALRTGFRAKYIADAARKVASGELDLSAVAGMTHEEAQRVLCTVKGVGPKVASCALLYGFGKTDAFPVDVWMRRALDKYFPNGLDLAALGPNAGMAQQYLFYYERYINSGKH